MNECIEGVGELGGGTGGTCSRIEYSEEACPTEDRAELDWDEPVRDLALRLRSENVSNPLETLLLSFAISPAATRTSSSGNLATGEGASISLSSLDFLPYEPTAGLRVTLSAATAIEPRFYSLNRSRSIQDQHHADIWAGKKIKYLPECVEQNHE